ncbi:MAG: efflux RND transporter periplasmic adaptor subunit [Acidobacteria bacterium]|nr:efflux RND transporter periplasmic adaptor subunit [Acidobacteriota bacterium]
MFRKTVLILIGISFLAVLGVRLRQEWSARRPEGDGGGNARAATRPEGQRPSLLVESAAATPHVFESRLEVLGELKPQASVEVMSRISGRLQQVLAERGQSVREGQLLAVVDDADLQQQLRRAEAAVTVARAAENREQVNYENLQVQLERYRKLHQENLISTQDLQDQESRTRVAKSQWDLSAAQVEQALASLRELKIQQEQTRIYAPLSGAVGTRYLEPGALVSPSVPILSMLNLDRVKTVVRVMESSLREVRLGLPAEVTVDAYPDQTYHGRVTRTSPFLDPDTRSAEVEIEISNPGWKLKPGMFARVKIDANIQQQALAIPRSALLTRGSQKGVFLLSKERTAVFQPIEVGQIHDDLVQVLSGLQPNTQVISTGAQNINEGDRVQLLEGDRRPPAGDGAQRP